MNIIERVLVAAAAVTLVMPGTLTDLIGLACFVIVLVWNRMKSKNTPAEPAAQA